MKTFLLLLALAAPAMAQPASTATVTQTERAPELTQFDLDFPGGKPADLQAAIEKSSGKPLNLVIPVYASNIALPPLRMRSVTVASLFYALSESSSFPAMIRFTHHTNGSGNDGLSDRTVWYLNAPNSGPQICKFFYLRNYLNEGLSVDDITTAIQTAWKMMGAVPGEQEAPQLSFHKETSLLIAVGEGPRLGVIQDVLQQLSQGMEKPSEKKPKA